MRGRIEEVTWGDGYVMLTEQRADEGLRIGGSAQARERDGRARRLRDFQARLGGKELAGNFEIG
jgi:hypothetical protein